MLSRPLRIPTEFGNSKQFILIATVVLLLTGIIATSHESLWIDELMTAEKAVQESLFKWWENLCNVQTSERQMPLYLLWIWVWCHVAGHSEFALRIAGLPLALLGSVLLICSLPGPFSRKVALQSLICFCPFLWFYLNEARPYAMVYGATCVMLSGLLRISRQGAKGGYLLFCCGSIILSGLHLLGMLWVASASCWVAWVIFKKPGHNSIRRPVCSELALIILSVVFLAGLTIYYLWTFSEGARASGLAKTSLTSLVFAFYELFGFAGLGPGRLQLRDVGINSLIPYWPALFALAVALMLCLIAGARNAVISRFPFMTSVLIASALPILGVVTLGVFGNFRVVGRHMTPVLPFILLWLALGAEWLWRRGMLGRALFCVIPILWCLSCGMLRYDLRHAREDYRAAARATQELLEKGHEVLWAAEVQGITYYNIITRDNLHTLHDISPSQYSRLDSIVLSRPDIYDNNGSLRRKMESEHWNIANKLTGFTVYLKDRLESTP